LSLASRSSIRNYVGHSDCISNLRES
jgi:hypothetical protein